MQKAKELKDLALTAADWAKHKGLGEEAVKLAMSYAMDASRRMGELLQSTERAKGAAESAEKRSTHQAPRLEDLGITKKESSRAQKLAALPEETFQKVRSGEIPVSNIKQVEPLLGLKPRRFLTRITRHFAILPRRSLRPQQGY